MTSRIITVMAATIPFLLLSACSRFIGSGAGSAQPLVGTQWVLTELNGQPPLPDTTISAVFTEDGKVGGSSGCNRYNTTYTVDGDRITFGEPIAATLMACPDPLMAQENAFLQALANTTTFEIQGNTLTLFDAGGNPVAVFSAQSQELAGTSWEVISYNNGKEAVVSVIIGTQITANFGEDGQVTGNASCNSYFASYETDGEEITIGPAGMTEMFCGEPEGVMDQESQYLAALQSAATYKIEGDRLELRTAEGALAVQFTAAAMSQ